jgi:shikimate kinase
VKTSLALIGFMGVGKSAVGRILAAGLNKNFVEVDSIIERKAGKPIQEIFKDEGEIRFRELEIDTIKEIALWKNQVTACGGGVVLNRINIDRLKQESWIVWLTASAEAIAKRTGLNGDRRPVLKGVRNAGEIQSLVAFRLPFYERAADFTVDTTELDIQSAADQIVAMIKQHENNSK